MRSSLRTVGLGVGCVGREMELTCLQPCLFANSLWKHPDPNIVNARSDSTHIDIRSTHTYTQDFRLGCEWSRCVRMYLLPNGEGGKSIYLIISILQSFGSGISSHTHCTRGDKWMTQSSIYVLQCCNAASFCILCIVCCIEGRYSVTELVMKG